MDLLSQCQIISTSHIQQHSCKRLLLTYARITRAHSDIYNDLFISELQLLVQQSPRLLMKFTLLHQNGIQLVPTSFFSCSLIIIPSY